MTEHSYFTLFQSDISSIPLPERFTFPFCYEPHPLARLASQELQAYLLEQQDFNHNFGIEEPGNAAAIGKMFGVLVVRNAAGQLGYLSACSGKLAGHNNHKRLVPPVFDMLQKDSYFLQEEEILNALNKEIELLEQNPEIGQLELSIQELKLQSAQAIAQKKEHNKAAKKNRDAQRAAYNINPEFPTFEAFAADLVKQSLRDKHELLSVTQYFKQALADLEMQLNKLVDHIKQLKKDRKQKSAALQMYLFKQYYFLNNQLEKKNIADIFEEKLQQLPPAAAGECAAPKLLQYAFAHNLTAICMAEFWWGKSFGAEIRQHKQYYPACKNKCEPILEHMLKGMELDPNPLLVNTSEGVELPIVYEDDAFLIVNKPAEFLSVPGIHVKDSVLTRMQAYLPETDSPLIVHRLDMSTSGILVIAKTKDAHKNLQQQFANHRVTKRYEAVLSGRLEQKSGIIQLPLRVDLEDRPRQLVCYTYGKQAETHWEVIRRDEQQTLVSFYPITGRTHQLRVHAAHHLGLHTPIVGDDLYGNKADRLYLHAAYIRFKHPLTEEIFEFNIPSLF